MSLDHLPLYQQCSLLCQSSIRYLKNYHLTCEVAYGEFEFLVFFLQISPQSKNQLKQSQNRFWGIKNRHFVSGRFSHNTAVFVSVQQPKCQLQMLNYGSISDLPADDHSTDHAGGPVYLLSLPMVRWRETHCHITRERIPSVRAHSSICRRFCLRCTDAYSTLEVFVVG